jgi:hypothetical protein
MTATALENRPCQAELTQVSVVVAPAAIARDAPVARAVSGFAVLGRRVMTTVAKRRGMRADERPGTVIDLREIPPPRVVTVRAAPLSHLLCELIAMGVGVAIGAGLLRDVQIEARPGRRVAGGARCRHVLSGQREGRGRVELDVEEGRTKPVYRMAGFAFAAVSGRELAPVAILVTVGAADEC